MGKFIIIVNLKKHVWLRRLLFRLRVKYKSFI